MQALASIIVELGLGLAALNLARALKLRVDDHEERIAKLEAPHLRAA
jgi:hypothetical protein